MIERKYFVCGRFGHITYNYRNEESKREKRSTLILSNKFEVLRSRVMNIEEESRREIKKKNRKMILREERAKKEKLVEVQKTRVESSGNSIEKKKKLLRDDSEDWIEIKG